jgi:MoaA/NifB/PqqE/SkfB family radical SAM enzyme
MLQIVGLEVTTRCNLSCTHCLQEPGGAHDLPLPVLAGLLPQLEAYGKPVIALTGGEPTLHPQFLDLVRLIASHGHRLYVVTNARTFSEMAPRLVREAGEALTGFSFSLESPVEAEHDSIRGEGSYREVLMAMAWTSARGLSTSVQAMLTPLSVLRLNELVELCANLGAGTLCLSHLIPTPRAVAAGLALSLDERAEAEAAIRRLGDGRGLPVRMGVGCADPSPLLTCPFTTGEQIFVDASGQLCLCCQVTRTVTADDGDEVVADLARTPLLAAHQALVGRLAELQRARLRDAEAGSLTEADLYPCLYCMRHLGRLQGLVERCGPSHRSGGHAWQT